MIARQRLRALLVAEIEAMDNANVFCGPQEPLSAEEMDVWRTSKENLRVLKEAVDGLDCLDWGEVPDIFEPTKGRWGEHPATAQLRTAEIASYVAVLRKRGLSEEAAIGVVKEGLDVSEHAVEQWIEQARKDERLRRSAMSER